MLPPESLPWALQHSIFILNNYLVRSSGKTSLFENYRYNYRSNIVGFGEIVLGDVCDISTQKLRLRNQHQKLRGIWIGRDLITNEHILALPLQYSAHPSTTTGAHRCRQITRVPREEQHDVNSLKDIYWPQLSDEIDFNTRDSGREHFNNLQKQNIATRDLQLQQPQDEEDIEQLQGVRPPVLPHHPQAVTPQQDQQPQVTHPPPGLPQPPQALLPRPPMVNNKQHHIQHHYFKDHLRRYTQIQYLHLQQDIVQQESMTIIHVDLRQKQLTPLTYLMKMNIKQYLFQTSWTSQLRVASYR